MIQQARTIASGAVGPALEATRLVSSAAAMMGDCVPSDCAAASHAPTALARSMAVMQARWGHGDDGWQCGQASAVRAKGVPVRSV